MPKISQIDEVPCQAEVQILQKITLNVYQTLSRLFQFAENVKCRQISLDLISWGPHLSLERERKFLRRLFTSSIKREIRHFHVVVMQQRRRNVQKGVMHVQTCCFAQ